MNIYDTLYMLAAIEELTPEPPVEAQCVNGAAQRNHTVFIQPPQDRTLVFHWQPLRKRAGRPPPRSLYYSSHYTFFPAGWQGENPGEAGKPLFKGPRSGVRKTSVRAAWLPEKLFSTLSKI